MFLAGDRNWEIDGNQVGSGLVAVGSNAAVSWTQRFHRQSGNILFADGSVMKLSGSQLRSGLAETGTNVNRLVFP
jgi:prepilin-type processing-associated H-X9-DG protein